MYCREQLVELSREYDKLEDLDATVMAVSTDDLSKANLIAEGLGLPFPILYNPDASMVKDYGVYNLLRDRLATPSTFVIDKSGIIRWKFIGRGISDRPSTAEILTQLRQIVN